MQDTQNHFSVLLEDSMVRLVPLTQNDFETLYGVASDPLIWEQHPDSMRYKREVFQSFFDSAVEGGTAYLIKDKNTDQVIGSSRYYEVNNDAATVAVGYTFLACAYWGGKYNYALKKLMLDHAFEKTHTVYFHIGSANYRSQQALLKLGGQKTGEEWKGVTGAQKLVYTYVIKKDDWLRKHGIINGESS